MRRFGLCLLILLCSLCGLCSATVFASSTSTISYTDTFAFLSSYPEYVTLYEVINNYGSANEVDNAYETLKASLGSSANDWTVLLKASLNCAHYYLEMAEKKNSKKAKQLLSNAEAIYEALEKSGSLEGTCKQDALKFTCLTIGYLASPISISKGLESIDVIDEAYKAYPNEVSIALLYAARKLNAPGIGGGDADVAFDVYASLVVYLEGTDGANTLPWDKFDIYCGMAKCYVKKGEKTQALEYYYKALSIYEHNDSVITEIGKLEKNSV